MNVVVVSNLKPVKLRGELSEGMILATDDGNSLKIVEAPGDSKPGTVAVSYTHLTLPTKA